MPNKKVEVKIINQSKNELPRYITEGASGMDVCASLDLPQLELKPLERVLVPTGLFVEIPPGFEIQIRPRSGLALNRGITCLNTPGTIDSDYRGEIKILLINLSDKLQVLHSGERVAQMVLAPVAKAQWIETHTLDETKRQAGGFGHTGS
ncbi:MAG: deoxyuridine 5'-triphosphate nucleotidohydrolase [Niastella sp. SCN 39-18]|nr:MAG: deoxyuridine 5'-triphosphate nucleotidohydrolase [Niastella sp. SCN 39-18]OJW09759.1 MAG: deoxyuridine 5'-triphosphate nucleotidohydrolase [Sphingobacteriales bacterium 39-19]